MKKYILSAIVLFCGIVLLPSCKKQSHEPKYVSLNETVKSGSTYSLDLGAYAARNSVASITTQAAHYTVSQVDRDPATSASIYHFSTDTKTAEQEKVVINLSEKNNGRCSHDDQKTVISINFTVQQ